MFRTLYFQRITLNPACIKRTNAELHHVKWHDIYITPRIELIDLKKDSRAWTPDLTYILYEFSVPAVQWDLILRYDATANIECMGSECACNVILKSEDK